MVRSGLITAFIIFLMDQLSKWFVVEKIFNKSFWSHDLFINLPFYYPLEITSFFNIVLVGNKGVSFGLFSADSIWGTYALVAIALILVIVIFLWLLKTDKTIISLSLGAIIGGAIGNIVDRIRFNAVVDFLDFHIHPYHWPAFNIADTAICIAVIFLLIDTSFGHKKDM